MHAKTKMTRRDYAWLRMDVEKNLMVINCALIFVGKLDVSRLVSTIEQRIADYPRFVQKVVLEKGCPYWENDPSFDIQSHLKVVRLDQTISENEFATHVSQIAHIPLDYARPLWNMMVFDKVGDGYAILFRLHHCISDGLGLVHLLTHLTDDNADSNAPLPELPHRPQASGGIRIETGMVSKAVHLAKVLLHVSRLSLLPRDLPTRLKEPLGGRKTLLWLPPLSLESLTAIAKGLQVSLNDLWIAAVAGALRQYLIEQGGQVDRKALRAAVTFNLREKSDAFRLGNEFTLVALDLPTNQASASIRVQEVNRRMKGIKGSYQARATLSFLSFAGLLPRKLQRLALDLFTSKASIIVTNLAGLPDERYLAGSKLSSFHCWVPQSGKLGAGFSFMSCAGKVRIGLYADEQAVDSPQRLLGLVHDAFLELGKRARINLLAEHIKDRVATPLAGRHDR